MSKPATHVLKPIGSVVTVDDNGYLTKTVSHDTFYKPLFPLIDEVIKIAESVFGKNLHSAYVRGSVAKGTFIPNISDLDIILVTIADCGDIAEEKYVQSIKNLELQHPEVCGIEKAIREKTEFLKSSNPIFKYQTVCVFGNDLTPMLPDTKPGKQTVVHLKKILESIDESIPRIEQQTEVKWIRNWSIWMCKQLIRSCHELLAENLQQFARDIYPCYKASADAWPEQEPMLRRVAEIAVFGTENKAELIEIMKQMKYFLDPKIKAFYM